MKHVVLYSGGFSSFAVACYVIEKYGIESTELLFTDTLIEDDDLYRFLIETVHYLSRKPKKPTKLLEHLKGIPDITQPEARKAFLMALSWEVNASYPMMHWVMDGRNPWECFTQERFIGNSRVDTCSKFLKREVSRKYMAQFDPNEVTVYLGIDDAESHRYYRAKPLWEPYKLEAPLIENPFFYEEVLQRLALASIKKPRLYELGFTHNNCGGFCVKAGLGQFKHLQNTLPDVYAHHETQEKKWQETIGKSNTVLRIQRNNVKRPITLGQFREFLQTGQIPEEQNYMGGCGCMLG